MEAIRKIQTVVNGEIHLQLPEPFWGKEVEIIVLSSKAAESTLGPQERLRMGTALANLGRRAGLTDEDIAAFEEGRNKTSAEPERLE
jgi:hypothetical protein